MPERGWRRRRREAAPVPELASQPPQPASPADDGRPAADGYLRSATRCYLRAGNLTDAASCLRQLGDHGQEADLYLQLGDYEQAATAYEDAGDVEAAAWVYAHHLDDPGTARAIIRRAEPRARQQAWDAFTPVAKPGPEKVPDPDRESPWSSHLRRVGERLARLPDEPPESGAQPETQPTARSRIVQLIGNAGWFAGDLPVLIEQARSLKQAAIGQNDWPAAYGAREIEGRLGYEQAARAAERTQSALRQDERRVRAFYCVQLLARCAAAEGAGQHGIVPVLRETQDLLADRKLPWVPRIETWGVAIAEVIRRYDQAALIFAASVRGQRPGAESRWSQWSARLLDTDQAMLASAELR